MCVNENQCSVTDLKEIRLVGCRIKANCPLVGPEIVRGTALWKNLGKLITARSTSETENLTWYLPSISFEFIIGPPLLGKNLGQFTFVIRKKLFVISLLYSYLHNQAYQLETLQKHLFWKKSGFVTSSRAFKVTNIIFISIEEYVITRYYIR